MNASPIEASRAAGKAPRYELRAASYNVRRCIGADGRADAQRIARVIGELDCEIVGLQEVDNDTGDSPAAMRLDSIAAATRMTAVPGLRTTHLGHYGNALLTRHSVLAVRRHDITYRRFEPRGALEVELQIDAGVVHVVVTHLGLAPWERRRQTQRILEIATDIPAVRPVILLGDINEWLPRGRPLRWLHAQFGRPPHARSFPARWPLFALDRIWARPRGAVRSLEAHASPLARIASDHLPVKACVQLPL